MVSGISSGRMDSRLSRPRRKPYECPHTRDEALIRKLQKLEGRWLKVTVEVDEKLDASGKQHPKLLDICALQE